jgi:hypothetical protein
LKGVRTQIGQKTPGHLKMGENLGTIDASAYLMFLVGEKQATCESQTRPELRTLDEVPIKS